MCSKGAWGLGSQIAGLAQPGAAHGSQMSAHRALADDGHSGATLEAEGRPRLVHWRSEAVRLRDRGDTRRVSRTN